MRLILAIICCLPLLACSDDTKQPTPDAKAKVEASVQKDGSVTQEVSVPKEASVAKEASVTDAAPKIQ